MITQFWQEKEAENPSDPVPFNIHEQDRLAIRNTVVEAIIQAPDPIRYSFNVEGKMMQAQGFFWCSQGPNSTPFQMEFR